MQLVQILHLLILISLTTTLTEAKRISIIGCNDTCGVVKIPFPFGIGTRCSKNEWYNVHCNSSTLYLSALNNTEVLYATSSEYGIDGHVILNVSMTFDCVNLVQHSTFAISDASPFYISPNYNKLFVEGCGANANVMVNGGIVASCSTICHSNTVSDRNKCFGIGCCQSMIDDELVYNVKSFRLNLIAGLEGPAGNETCGGSAFLMAGSYFKARRFPRQSVDRNNTYYVPIRLEWYSDGKDDYTSSPE